MSILLTRTIFGSTATVWMIRISSTACVISTYSTGCIIWTSSTACLDHFSIYHCLDHFNLHHCLHPLVHLPFQLSHCHPSSSLCLPSFLNISNTVYGSSLILTLCHNLSLVQHIRHPVSPLHFLCINLLHTAVMSSTKYIHLLLQLPVSLASFKQEHHNHLIQKWCVSLICDDCIMSYTYSFFHRKTSCLFFAGSYDTASQCLSVSLRQDTCWSKHFKCSCFSSLG